MAIGLTKLTAVNIETTQSVAAGALTWASDTGGTVINAANSEWFSVVNIQVAVAFHAAGNGDAEVHVRKSVDNGASEDTPEAGTHLGTIGCATAATVIRTFQVYDFDYLDVGLKNNDSTNAIVYTANYDGFKITGMAT